MCIHGVILKRGRGGGSEILFLAALLSVIDVNGPELEHVPGLQ